MTSILIVEDEKKIADFLRKGLSEKGYTVDVASDSDGALEDAVAQPHDLIILDLLLPGSRDGLDLCRELRRRGVASKILMLTARDTVENKIEGLDSGADDYLVKPFSYRELLARLRALTRRSEIKEIGPLECDGLLYEPSSRTARMGDATVELTMREGAILELLLRRKGKVVSRAEIAARVWEDTSDLSTNIIDVYINSIRKKIDGPARGRIRTVRGVGYSMGA
ncbi:MAG TPA: response regulator transcription factor [Thermoanaerobaculia bacterium]|jgi:DNA-binding response OmpR family regulator|nr:response regulator transcription factor [Thermoanaerobaculia bacterium]